MNARDWRSRMEWYEQRFVNHRDWILDHLELLGLDSNETILVLLIDFLNEHQMDITMELLHKKTGISLDEVNQTVSVLCAKNYLKITAAAGTIHFVLDGLFKTDIARDQNILDHSLFDVFETELQHTLTSREMEKISEWNRTTDRKLILYALREASTYQKLSLPYVESILKRWKDSNVTAQMIEEGKGYGRSNDSK